MVVVGVVTRSNVCTHGVARARTDERSAECLYRGNAERLLESRIVGQTHRSARARVLAPLRSALLRLLLVVVHARSPSFSLCLPVAEQSEEDVRKGGVKESQREGPPERVC